jgi:putative DNA primase/helicase
MSAWVNYDSVISQLVAAGLVLDKDINVDNRWQTWRVEGEDRERRGRSILKEWTSSKGDSFVVGLAGVWHGNSFDQIKIEIEKRQGERDLSADELKAMAAARKAMLKEAEAAQKAQAKRAAEWAGIVWQHSQPVTKHDYLTRKQIQPHGTRQLGAIDPALLPGLDPDNAERLKRAAGSLLVPMHDTAGNIQGLQCIGKMKTFWPTGMAMSSTFGLLGPLPRSGILILTEGFATAASLREATGYPVAYAFSANNLGKAAKALRKAAPGTKILIAADDDYLTDGNPGATAAAQAAAEVTLCDWLKPDFLDDAGQDRRAGRKLTDFNDLAVGTGVPLILAHQVHAKLDALGWRDGAGVAQGAGVLPRGGGGEGSAMVSRLTIDEAVARYVGTYGFGGDMLFDEQERRLVHKKDVVNLLPRHGWDALKDHSAWRVVRDTEVGFDPTEQDASIKCNLFRGWPSEPVAGKCEALLDLLRYQCSNEGNADELFRWVLNWLAYPVQHRGAKMQTALVFHGGQGTGKSRFFEAYGSMFGPYFRVLGQEALEDKFNSDWAGQKMFILADEVMARQEMYHVKNRLKGFITGDSIRVNPKNLAAHTERNHMNIVFLSNERFPLVLEPDDRRFVVVYVPPKLSDDFFQDVNAEIAAGGVAALQHYLLNLDLGDFKPWTKPPMTKAKSDLIELGRSSEERFVEEWIALEMESPDGKTLPFGPCLGSHLYRAYELWCERHGERKRGAKDLISCVGKRHGWQAGESRATWTDLHDRSIKKRKMVVPSPGDLAEALKKSPMPEDRWTGAHVYPQPEGSTLAEWLTTGYLAFAQAMGIEP